jgi:hypothetical protein
MRFHALSRATVVLALIATATACEDSTPLAPPDADGGVQAADPAPAGLVTATVAVADFDVDFDPAADVCPRKPAQRQPVAAGTRAYSCPWSAVARS